MRLSPTAALLTCAAALLPAGPLAAQAETAQAETMTFEDPSVFAVVTHRGGLAGGLAHNHLAVAERYLVDFAFDAEDPANSTLHFSTLVEDLVIDDPEHKAAWSERILALGLVDEFGDLDEETRAEVRGEMLDSDQLDPENHPVIAATLTDVQEDSTTVGPVHFPWVGRVEVTIHGTTVTRDVPLRWEQDGEALVIEAVGRFEFEEFGIEPYSAFLGTVKVQNEFEIYLNLRAVPAEPTG